MGGRRGQGTKLSLVSAGPGGAPEGECPKGGPALSHCTGLSCGVRNGPGMVASCLGGDVCSCGLPSIPGSGGSRGSRVGVGRGAPPRAGGSHVSQWLGSRHPGGASGPGQGTELLAHA